MIKNKNYPYYEHKRLNNLKELILDKRSFYADNIAFSYKRDNRLYEISYKDFYDDVKNLSNYFYNKYKNKHIGIMGENSYEYLITFFAIVLSGNVAVLIDKDKDEKSLNNLAKKSDVRDIYYSESYLPFLKKNRLSSTPLENIFEYVNLGKKYDNKYEIDDDKCAVIFFTSGTTGSDKAVMLSQRNIAFDIYAASSLFKPNGKVVSFLPFHHAFGLITSVLKPFYYGVEVFINSSLKNVSASIKEVEPETLFAVPLFVETFYKMIWKTAKKEKKVSKVKSAIKMSNTMLKINIDMRKRLFKKIHSAFGGNLHYIICGGAYLNPYYVKWFHSIGIEILNGYGITECSPVVSVNRNEYRKLGSVGVICRDVSVKIINNEICVKGDNVMLGYYKDKKATESVIIDGYYHTGDLGYMDDDFLFITGRKKNIIILNNGENVSPEVIEAVLLKDKGINEVVVYEENNKLMAMIYPTEEYIDDDEYFNDVIHKYNEEKALSHQISGFVLRSSEFKKNSNQKILRDRIKE